MFSTSNKKSHRSFYYWLWSGGIVILMSIFLLIWLRSPKNVSGEYAVTHPQLDGSPRIPAIDLRTEDAAIITINDDPEQRLGIHVEVNDACIRFGETLAITLTIANEGSTVIDHTFTQFDLTLSSMSEIPLSYIEGKPLLPRTLELDVGEIQTYVMKDIPYGVIGSIPAGSLRFLAGSTSEIPEHIIDFFPIHTATCVTDSDSDRFRVYR